MPCIHIPFLSNSISNQAITSHQQQQPLYMYHKVLACCIQSTHLQKGHVHVYDLIIEHHADIVSSVLASPAATLHGALIPKALHQASAHIKVMEPMCGIIIIAKSAYLSYCCGMIKE